MKWVKNEIKKLHVIKNLNFISKIFEIHVTYQIDNFIKIDQDYYIQQVLAEFDMKHAKWVSVLLNFSLNFESQDIQLLNVKVHKIYRWMIRRMMFMIIEIWIDIATAVNWLSVIGMAQYYFLIKRVNSSVVNQMWIITISQHVLLEYWSAVRVIKFLNHVIND